MGIERLVFRNSKATLTPTVQVMLQALQYEPVQLAEFPAGVPVAEISGPGPEPQVDLRNQRSDRQPTAVRTRQFANPFLRPGERLLRGKHVEIPPWPAKQVALKIGRAHV